MHSLVLMALLLAAGSSDLFVAIRNGDHARVQKLLAAGADVNAADSEGTTALMHAVVECDLAKKEGGFSDIIRLDILCRATYPYLHLNLHLNAQRGVSKVEGGSPWILVEGAVG